jgi:hypothetical protein
VKERRELGLASHHELRSAPRITVAGSITMRQRGARSIAVIIEDISPGGCRVQWPHALNIGDRVWVTLPGLQAIPSVVIWTADFKLGCRFEVPLHIAVFKSLAHGASARRDRAT